MRRTSRMLAFRHLALALAVAVPAAAPAADDSQDGEARDLWVFSQGFGDQAPAKPRGGTTEGAPVTPAPDPAPVYKRLQEPDLSAKEKDRRAILAMTGEFRTTFEFVETAALLPGYERDSRPYHSWATEYVFVLEDSPDVIRLQHILVMIIVKDDGSLSEPIVTKHWRQDWHWQPDSVWRYRGDRVWDKEPVPEARAQGAWKQVVYQVDDSPRYEAIGRWHHDHGVSEWRSENFKRPLPRRERSVRDDYQALAGRHDIVITPHGWQHAQDNRKLRATDDGGWRAIADEVGLNRYRRITGRDFSPGQEYWREQAPFWAAVRAEWRALRAQHERLRIRHARDGETLFKKLFQAADELAGQDVAEQTLRERVGEIITPYVTAQPTN